MQIYNSTGVKHGAQRISVLEDIPKATIQNEVLDGVVMEYMKEIT
jgi:hypothetical protein